MNMLRSLLLLTLVVVGCKKSDNTPFHPPTLPAPTQFTALPAAETGISFANNVQDGEQFNILTYRNFYNGGGVAIGDINNDNLNDLYFTANMAQNSLFVNHGNWKFEEVTQKAGVGGTRSWSTGTTMADVNGDGWLDIYVCNSGDVAGSNKENELFINNGDAASHDGVPTFTEAAALWGLNDAGYGTHAAFFDCDADGDLDCYLLNNSFKDPAKISLYKNNRDDRDPLGGDKLLINNVKDPAIPTKFTDISASAGIYGAAIGFGLGVSVSDLNGDMLPDIYISNDFWERDYLYFNQGNNRFAEKLSSNTDHCSVSSMGADIADLDNDGDPEIFTTDMLAADNYRLKTMTLFDEYHLEDAKYRADFHYQILQNCLQLNDGNGQFSEVAHQSGVAATDWSWGALLFDFDNDGWKDIFVANGIYRDIMYLDFTSFINDKEAVRKKVTESGKYDWREFAAYLPSNKLSNYAFVNGGGMRFQNQASGLGLGDPSHSNGAAYGDLDNDGDLDLVVNNVNMPAFVYRNETNSKTGNTYLTLQFEGAGKNPFGIGTKVEIIAGGQHFSQQNFNTRGFQSCTAPDLVFGLGTAKTVDSLIVTWPNRKMQILTNVAVNQILTLKQSNANLTFSSPKKTQINTLFHDVTAQVFSTPATHHENRFNDFDNERLLPHMLSTEGPALATGDVNGDGLPDVVLGGGPDYPDQVFAQKSDGKFIAVAQPALETDKAAETTCLTLFDADKDGDLDLLAGSGGNEMKPITAYLLRYYENDGRGNFTLQKEKTPPAAGNLSCLVPGDIDGDGDEDLFIGARCVPGRYGVPPTSFLMRNNGNGQWEDITTRELAAGGMVTDAQWLDLDGDKDLDLLVASEWMPLVAFRNDGRGKFVPSLLPIKDENNGQIATEGWWNTVESSDLDGDGDLDLILGNWGLNSKFKASAQQPMSLYVNDFDKNGKPEFILNWFTGSDNIAYPFASKPDITAQMPFLKKKILHFEDYAKMTYETLFTEEQRAKALAYHCAMLTSCIAWNEGNGAWRLENLPDEAQRFPVFAIVPADFNGDGHKDLFLGGNFFGLKPEGGHLDAGRGLILSGDGKRHFVAMPAARSGVSILGEIRDAVWIDGKKTRLIVGRNNAGVVVLE